MKHLVLGGVRSGKSRYAESLALNSQWPVTYISVTTPMDLEVRRRIQRYQSQHAALWDFVEEPVALASALKIHCQAERVVLVDCLTSWLSNLLMSKHPERITSEQMALIESLPKLPGMLILVSAEIGQGVMPDEPLAKRYVDLAGLLHQELASHCDQVTFLTAGLPTALKTSAKIR
jgi:adenosylcobinamide kinase/adenosylcobinamide-phosphate guanylyltransferase